MKLHILTGLVVAMCATSALAAPPVAKLSPEIMKHWGSAETVFIGKLKVVQAGPVGLSNPPVYTHRLTFDVNSVLRGSLKKGESLTGFHSIRQQMRPVFPEGDEVIAAVRFSPKTLSGRDRPQGDACRTQASQTRLLAAARMEHRKAEARLSLEITRAARPGRKTPPRRTATSALPPAALPCCSARTCRSPS